MFDYKMQKLQFFAIQSNQIHHLGSEFLYLYFSSVAGICRNRAFPEMHGVSANA